MSVNTFYSCTAFHDSLKGLDNTGHFRTTPLGIEYEVGELRGLLSFTGMHFRLGGANNRLLLITHPSTPQLTLHTSDLTVLKDNFVNAHPECAMQLKKYRKTKHLHVAAIVVVALLIVVTPLTFISSLDYFSAFAVKQMPVAWDTTLGEMASTQYRSNQKLMKEKKSDELLQPLTDPLIKALKDTPYQYNFTIVDDDTLNAFALPGGFVTIHSGLILKAETAEEFLGVIAHEISHVEERHGMRSIVNNAGIYMSASLLFGDLSGVLATLANTAPLLISQQYSRSFETDADENALKLMKMARVDPQGLPTFFEKMIAEEKIMLEKMGMKDSEKTYKTAMTFLSTHPASDKRMEHLRELIGNEQGDYLNLEKEFRTLQEAVREFSENANTR